MYSSAFSFVYRSFTLIKFFKPAVQSLKSETKHWKPRLKSIKILMKHSFIFTACSRNEFEFHFNQILKTYFKYAGFNLSQNMNKTSLWKICLQDPFLSAINLCKFFMIEKATAWLCSYRLKMSYSTLRCQIDNIMNSYDAKL